ncbi:hypothetical protein OVA07_05745 [Novosphingobium sp. SL115]|uniref:hypothetical protein n=1 Tax=Novosphingobium sp. SL115 TaxID=2995150 RepID=UPI0022762C93|nr:hypothetical protein [Novosphingobium sp. SL115]MCY1670513.1 hypothetical protein [Novosphingobium sp. SL115]
MSSHFDRLRRGERWWAAELVFRTIGIALLGGCYRLALVAHRTISVPPPHGTTPGEFALCVGIFLSLAAGLALTMEGPGLLRDLPVPPR